MTAHKLVIAEKPSVAASISAVLNANKRENGYFIGGGFIVTWCIGHLVGLAPADKYNPKYKSWRYEDLPIIPQTWKNIAASDKKKQLKIISELMNRSDVDTVICATDAGREGELIFRLVYEYCKCKKPIERLWISSMEESAISEGFRNLKPGAAYENLYQSALCRSQADWLVGINATRLFSTLYNSTLNIGRVQTPTLAMIVEREHTIKAFIKEPFYTAIIDCGTFTASGEKLKDKQASEHICAFCDGKSAVVTTVEKHEKSTAPPKLYDLTTLQREANRMYGYTAQQTLDYIQSLYEKKLATYPRTDSRYLTLDMRDRLPALVNQAALNIQSNAAIMLNVDAVINNSNVTDHHAIIPTMQIKNVDLSALPNGEKNILNMLCVRLVCAVGNTHTYFETSVIFECEDNVFKAKGKTVLQNGWKAVEEAFQATFSEKSNDDKEIIALPELSEGQSFSPVKAEMHEGFTSPPKSYTEDTLLSAMETAGMDDMPDDTRKGLGTPATRAAIIEKLVKSAFLRREGKKLLPTEKAINLITIVPNMLKSPQLTAEWENKLKQIERGETTGNAFMMGISGIVQSLVHTHTAPNPKNLSLFSNPVAQAKRIGKCPRCNDDVEEKTKGFFCGNRACSFALWKDNIFFRSKGKILTTEIATILLRDGCVAINSLYSEKTGKKYDAIVLLDDAGDKHVNFKLNFDRTK